MEAPIYYCRQSATRASHGGHLPHWAQRCTVFATFRLWDSLPATKCQAFEAEHDEWLAAHPRPWDEQTEALYHELFPTRFQKWLDAGYGSCLLADEASRADIESALRHFDSIRYSLYAFVVMPNHVHVLFMPTEGFDGLAIVRDWKSYTAHSINRRLKRSGPLWQKESYDHLVRNVESFNAIRSYIRANDSAKAYDVYAK